MSRQTRTSRSLRRHGKDLVKKRSGFLIGTGVASLLGAVGLTFIKARDIVDALDEVDADIKYDCEHEHIEPPSRGEKLWMQTKKLAPIMGPPVAMATFGTVCIVAGHKIDSKEIVSLSALYQTSEKARRDYMDSVKKHLGEKKEAEIRDDYYQKRAEEKMPDGPDDRNIIHTGEGDNLFFDEGTGRFFRASTQWLDHCRHAISNEVFANDYASANELASLIGLEPTTYGNKLGFNSDDLDPSTHLIDMRWNRCYMSPWGEPYAVLEYDVNERFRELR